MLRLAPVSLLRGPPHPTFPPPCFFPRVEVSVFAYTPESTSPNTTAPSVLVTREAPPLQVLQSLPGLALRDPDNSNTLAQRPAVGKGIGFWGPPGLEGQSERRTQGLLSPRWC